jgi:hypothetical protein
MVYGMDLKYVIGATKYHTHEQTLRGNGFTEDGKTLRTAEDLKQNWDDSHAWLEDDEGNVYDCITDRDYEMISEWDKFGRRWKMKAGFIQGESYKSLRSKGYELIPFNDEQRKVVLDVLIERSKVKCPNYTELLENAL